ncbi:hypothetical protein PFISCL1PPCAC_22300, partial [Pristionchus fissidentatus]
DRYRQKLDSLHAAMEEKMKETMMKNLDERAKMNFSESQKEIDTLRMRIDKLEVYFQNAASDIVSAVSMILLWSETVIYGFVPN